MGGGGGDGDFQAKQDQLEAKKQAARDALNAQFGVARSGVPAVAPDRAKFTTPAVASSQIFAPDEGGGSMVGAGGSPEQFDQAGYDAAKAAYDLGQNASSNGSARDSLYQTVRDSAFNVGKRHLDEDNTKAQRNLKFELFAHGLNGGSEDINQNALRQRTYDQGILDLGGKADAAKAAFRGNDEAARLNLLQSIDAGTDQGSAIASAIGQMGVNSDRAAADAQGTTLGDLFANTGLMYNTSQLAKGRQAGQDWWNTYSAGQSKPSRGANGIVTGVGS